MKKLELDFKEVLNIEHVLIRAAVQAHSKLERTDPGWALAIKLGKRDAKRALDALNTFREAADRASLCNTIREPITADRLMFREED